MYRLGGIMSHNNNNNFELEVMQFLNEVRNKSMFCDTETELNDFVDDGYKALYEKAKCNLAMVENVRDRVLLSKTVSSSQVLSFIALQFFDGLTVDLHLHHLEQSLKNNNKNKEVRI